jgi:hypothetical protein
MMYAILVDIHGNLEALEVVLDDCQKQGVDQLEQQGTSARARIGVAGNVATGLTVEPEALEDAQEAFPIPTAASDRETGNLCSCRQESVKSKSAVTRRANVT